MKKKNRFNSFLVLSDIFFQKEATTHANMELRTTKEAMRAPLPCLLCIANYLLSN